MKTRNDLLYSKTHEWVKIGGSKATVGITDFAQENLGEIVFIDLPKAGGILLAGSVLCVAESVKAATEIYVPVAGKITSVNAELTDHPELINQDPYGSWIAVIELEDPAQAAALMDEGAYRDYCLRGQ